MPRTILFCEKENNVILFEHEKVPDGCHSSGNQIAQGYERSNNCIVKLVPNHVINGSVPLNYQAK